MDEEKRLEYLTCLGILDTDAESEFDDLVLLASRICETPIALFSLVDRDRQWFKAKRGMPATETTRDIAFCSHAIQVPSEVLIVPDTLEDARFRKNPLVLFEPGIRFYAGAPVVTREGAALGTICVIDTKPRRLSQYQIACLEALSRLTTSLLELRELRAAK